LIFFDAAMQVIEEWNWTVFPVSMPKPPGKKTPLVPPSWDGARDGGRNAASRDPATIEEWGRRWPNAAVAVPTGPENGIFVIDEDVPGAMDLLKRFGRLPATLTARSGRGPHLYFAHMGGKIVNRAGKMVAKARNPYHADTWVETHGLDVRGDGGSIVVPPSIHHSGRPYRWIDSGVSIALPPIWLLQMLGEKREAKLAKGSDRAPAPSLQGICDRLARTKEGSRNASLNEAAFLAGKTVRAGLASENEAIAALLHHGMALGLAKPECLQTIRSGLKAGYVRAR
jgi:Bifunctional DNA primase/polymerase, N-terminal